MVNKPQECLFCYRKANHLTQLLLEELNVESEIASARVSEAISRIKRDNGLGEHQGYENREVLTFVDGGLSIEWMKRRG
jgi:D-citramalate synthase